MQQLKMYRLSAPVEEITLPKGFSFRYFDMNNYDRDVNNWLEICRHGLISENCGYETFEETIINYPDVKAEDIVFVEYEGKPAATVVAVIHPNGNTIRGYVHMVACKTDYRGLGIGNELNKIALSSLEKAGCPDSYLTTDDFRLPAIKSYLRYGFLPVLYDSDMLERWAKALAELGIESVPAVDENYKPCGEIKAAKKTETELKAEKLNGKKYKAAIFDLDGTVADTIDDLVTAMNEFLGLRGYGEKTRDDILKLINNGPVAFVTGAIPRHLQTDPTEIEGDVKLYNKCYDRHYNEQTHLFEGMGEMIRSLKENGIRVAMHSNKGQSHVEAITEKLLPGVFEVVLGAGHYLTKPNPEGTLAIAEKLGVTSDECIFVGDSNVDMNTANNAKMLAVGVNWGYRDENVLRESGADVIVSSPKEIADIVYGNYKFR